MTFEVRVSLSQHNWIVYLKSLKLMTSKSCPHPRLGLFSRHRGQFGTGLSSLQHKAVTSKQGPSGWQSRRGPLDTMPAALAVSSIGVSSESQAITQTPARPRPQEPPLHHCPYVGGAGGRVGLQWSLGHL